MSAGSVRLTPGVSRIAPESELVRCSLGARGARIGEGENTNCVLGSTLAISTPPRGKEVSPVLAGCAVCGCSEGFLIEEEDVVAVEELVVSVETIVLSVRTVVPLSTSSINAGSGYRQSTNAGSRACQ